MLAQTVLIAAMLVTLLAGLFFNYRQATELKSELGSLRLEVKADIARLDGKIDVIQSDLRHFYQMTGKLEGRLEALERRQA